MKKKLLLIVEALGGGVRTHILDLVVNLNKSKYDIYLLYSRGRNDKVLINSIEMLKNHATIIESKYMQRQISITKDFLAYLECKRVINKIKPDIVHCHSTKAGFYGRIAAKELKVKKIYYTPHAYYFQNNYKSKVLRSFYIGAELILSRHFTTKTFNVSKGERDVALHSKLDKPEKFSVIYNGIPEIPEISLQSKDSIRKELFIKDSDVVVGVTARLNEQKDPLTFAKIAEKIISKYKNVHFIYIGDGPLFEPIQEFIKKKNLVDKFHLLGFREDANLIVSSFDIYLLTSLYEGLPYSVIEALRAGVPVIATRTTGNDEIIIEGENGYLFDIKDINQAVKIISELIENPKSIDGKKVIASYYAEYSLDKMITRIESEYSQST